MFKGQRDCVPARPTHALRVQRVVGDFLWYSGLVALARRYQCGRPTARILAYHHVLAPDAAGASIPWPLWTNAAAFARQMEYVARHYRPLALPTLVDHIERGESIPPGSVVITLDDGYRDQLRVAIPALRTIGLPAMVALVAHGKAESPGDQGVNGAARADLASLADWATVSDEEGTFAFMSHSMTHRDLTLCEDGALRDELVNSRCALHMTGITTDIFCYPGGMHNAAVRAATAAAGYRAALTCAPGAVDCHSDPFALRRVLVGASPDHFVAAQLAGLLDGPAWLYHGLNRLRLWRRRLVASDAAGVAGPARQSVTASDGASARRCLCVASPLPIMPPLPTMEWPRVTIVVPTYNERDTIDSCLTSITTQDYPHDRLEILVVDGGSDDDTTERAARYPGVRVLANLARDAESAKLIGLRAATGDLFMYLDADADFVHEGVLKALVTPMKEDATLVSAFTRFVTRPGAAPLERCLGYHPLQLGPLLRRLCVDIDATRLHERVAYTVCCFGGGRVPPVGLCLYRLEVVRAIVASRPGFRWVDVGMPALLAEAEHGHVAYVPQAGIYHGRHVTLRSLVARQRRDATTTYLPRATEREFRYVEFSSARSVLDLAHWVVSVNLLLPPLWTALKESWRQQDLACLYGFPLALAETNGVAATFLRRPEGRALARRGLTTLGRTILNGRYREAGALGEARPRRTLGEEPSRGRSDDGGLSASLRINDSSRPLHHLLMRDH